MTYKERLIELLQHSPTDAMGNHGVGAMADHLMDNGLVIKELYEDMEERIANQLLDAFDKDYTCGDPYIEYDALRMAMMDL